MNFERNIDDDRQPESETDNHKIKEIKYGIYFYKT